MKKGILLIAGVIICTLAFGQERHRPQRVPANPNPIAWIQPDKGDTVMMRLIGDENWHCEVTLDGWIIAKNDKGVLCYAKEIGDRQYKATRRRAHSEGCRSKCEERWLKKHGLRFPSAN